MRAVRVNACHEPPQLEEVPEPTIQGPHDVIVKVGGAGLCRTDLHVIEGPAGPRHAPHADLLPGRRDTAIADLENGRIRGRGILVP